MQPVQFKSLSHQISDTEKQWFAIRTQLKCEKKVLHFLTLKSIETYLPIQKYTRRYGRRIALVEKPLINNYLFVKISRKDYVAVLDTQFVFGFVKFGDQLLHIPEQEILFIKKVIGEFHDIELNDEEIAEGAEIEIIGGQLTGLKAKLVERKGKNKVLIELQSVGVGLLIDIDARFIQRTQKLKIA
ncbi:MAG: UpxY family transcription antiterminator [Saprospiraceae bacterium]|nr:UpxY family transcription antiterminator [Saprospiraceae bacterium]